MIFILDIDGTITKSKQEVSGYMKSILINLMSKYPVYFVTGGTYESALRQLGRLANLSDNTFVEMGNNSVIDIWDGILNGKELCFPRKVFDFFCDYEIDARRSMLNVKMFDDSRRGNLTEKEEADRVALVENFNYEFSEYQALLGGQVSIDIIKKDRDKSQILNHIQAGETIFFGDKCFEHGNDYDIALECSKYYQVDGPTMTAMIIKNNYLTDLF